MKPLLIIAAASLLYACTGKQDGSKISEKLLKGNWVVSYAAYCDSKGNPLPKLRGSQNGPQPASNYGLLTIYSFNGAGRYQSDSGGLVPDTGAISIHDSMVQLKGGAGQKVASSYWDIVEAGEGIMTVLTDWPGGDNNKIRYELIRLKEDTGFNIAGISWKKALDSVATAAQLRNRLKEQLNYYAGYFRTLSQNGITVFAPGKMICPISLYSGALGTKPINECPLWIRNMGSEANAQQAFQMLKNCFQVKFKYPEAKDNFMMEYAIVLNHLAKQL